MSDFNPEPIAFSSDSPAEPSLPITSEMTNDMRVTSKWAQFMGVISLIGTALSALGMIVALFLVLGNFQGVRQTVFTGGMVTIFLLLGAVFAFYAYVSVLLYRYGDSLRNYVRGGSQQELEVFFEQQSKFWKAVGISSAVLLVFYFLALIFIAV